MTRIRQPTPRDIRALVDFLPRLYGDGTAPPVMRWFALHTEGYRTAAGPHSPCPGTFGAGTIIGGRQSRHHSHAIVPADQRVPEKDGVADHLRLRRGVTVHVRPLRLSAAPTTGRPVSGSPPWCACLRLGLSSGAFRWLTVTSAASTDGWSASGHVPLRTGRSAVEFDVSVDGFPEQGRQVSSPTRP